MRHSKAPVWFRPSEAPIQTTWGLSKVSGGLDEVPHPHESHRPEQLTQSHVTLLWEAERSVTFGCRARHGPVLLR